jgi:hypothetical protein
MLVLERVRSSLTGTREEWWGSSQTSTILYFDISISTVAHERAPNVTPWRSTMNKAHTRVFPDGLERDGQAKMKREHRGVDGGLRNALMGMGEPEEE